MSPEIVSHIYLPGMEIITTLCNKMIFSYLLYKRHIMTKLILLRCKNMEQRVFRIKTRIFFKSFYRTYEIMETLTLPFQAV